MSVQGRPHGRSLRAASTIVIVLAAVVMYGPTIRDYFLQDDFGVVGLFSQRPVSYFPRWFMAPWTEDIWGYVPDEALGNDALIDETYVGIRPAPGYPACPDHTEKATLFRMLDAERNAGVRLTESFAMYPAASVSGYYFSHPRSQYFVVGRLSREQVADYAKRKGMTLAQAERWLASNLDYDPE